MTKKLMALLLAVLMAVSLLPMPAMAGDAQVITDLSGISAGGSYVVDKSVKDIVLSAPLTLDKDVTLELTGQTVRSSSPTARAMPTLPFSMWRAAV